MTGQRHGRSIVRIDYRYGQRGRVIRSRAERDYLGVMVYIDGHASRAEALLKLVELNEHGWDSIRGRRSRRGRRKRTAYGTATARKLGGFPVQIPLKS